MVNQHFLSRLAWFASLFALIVIALGAFTRLIDAGLGCPDWPGCYGQITVPLTQTAHKLASLQFPASPLVAYKAWAEMIHRYFVGGLSVLIIAIIVTIVLLAVCAKSARIRGNFILAVCLVILLGYQIMLGQWTVTLKLLPIIVSQHLLGGYLILSTLWVIHLNNQPKMLIKDTKPTQNILPWAILGFILLLIQIMLGAWTSTNYASLSCADLPFCMNDQVMIWHLKEAFHLFLPANTNYEGGVLPVVVRQTIQMTHRFGALILTCYLLFFVACTSLRLKHHPDLLKSLYLILGLLCVQLCLGMSNVIFKLPLATAMGHTLIAALLMLSMITFILKLIRINHGVAVA